MYDGRMLLLLFLLLSLLFIIGHLFAHTVLLRFSLPLAFAKFPPTVAAIYYTTRLVHASLALPALSRLHLTMHPRSFRRTSPHIQLLTGLVLSRLDFRERRNRRLYRVTRCVRSDYTWRSFSADSYYSSADPKSCWPLSTEFKNFESDVGG